MSHTPWTDISLRDETAQIDSDMGGGGRDLNTRTFSLSPVHPIITPVTPLRISQNIRGWIILEFLGLSPHQETLYLVRHQLCSYVREATGGSLHRKVNCLCGYGSDE